MGITNIMSIDLEDNYCDLPFSTWNRYDSRVHLTTKAILKLLKNFNAHATFFSVGYIAQKNPELIEEIKSNGHEIANHGYSHTNVADMNPESFKLDLIKSQEILEKLSGEKVLGFRAPYFIREKHLWMFEILKKHSLLYDSSIFPVKPYYGISGTLRHFYRISDKNPLEEDHANNFIEIPMATLQLPLIGNVPIAGGFHLRFFPYQFVTLGIKQLNKSGYPAMCYVHPEDLDSHRPHLPGYGWHYYWGLKKAKKKFEALLRNFRFSSVRDVIDL